MVYRHVFFCLLIVGAESAKILAFFPTPSISHQVVFRPIVKELLKRGHEIVLVTTDASYPEGHAPENLTEIDLHDLSYSTWQQMLAQPAGSNDNWQDQIKFGFLLLAKIFMAQLQTDKVKYVLKNETFDLLMLEACVRPTLALSHLFKVPVIQLSSFGGVMETYDVLGAPSHPILYPEIFRLRSYNLTLWEKLTDLYKYYNMKHYYLNYIEEIENEMLREHFGPNFPPLRELKNNIDMVFLNIHRLWDDNRPVPPGIIHLGGIHQNPAKELPQDLKAFLDASKHGVIYISFGTNVLPSQLPRKKIQMFIDVLSRLPYEVLWKWDKDEMPGKTENIWISKWLPQSDLLCHPKIKLFITQGGLQSTDEAINAVVPVLGIPLFADQWYNTEKYVRYNIGKNIEMGTLTEDVLREAIEEIIGNDSYRRSIAKIRSIMHDQPQTPLSRAVWWTEHLIRHGGGRHLRAPTANISYAEYLDVQLLAVLASAGLVSLGLLGMVLYSLMGFIARSLRRSEKVKLH